MHIGIQRLSKVIYTSNNISCLVPKVITTCSCRNVSDNSVSEMRPQKTLEGLKKWIEVYKFEGGRVPNKLNDEDYEILLDKFNNVSSTKATSYLNFLFMKELKKQQSIDKRMLVKEINENIRELKRTQETQHITYGIWKNALFGKFRKQSVVEWHDNKVINAMKFGQQLVIDCDFDDEMTGRERPSYAKQMVQSISINRFHPDPFDIYFCNQDMSSKLLRDIEVIFPTLFDPPGPNIVSKSYLDLFPRHKLVYLTPNARTEMTSFDPEAIYIIGGLVDLGAQKPLTYAKCKRERITAMRLPLERLVKCWLLYTCLPLERLVKCWLLYTCQDRSIKAGFLKHLFSH